MGLWEYGASSVIVEDVHLIKSIVTVCFLIFCNFIGASIQVSFLLVWKYLLVGLFVTFSSL